MAVTLVRAELKESGVTKATFEGPQARLADNVPPGWTYSIVDSRTIDSELPPEADTVRAILYEGGVEKGYYMGSGAQLAANTFSGGSSSSPVVVEQTRTFVEEQAPVKATIRDNGGNVVAYMEAPPRQVNNNVGSGGYVEWN